MKLFIRPTGHLPGLHPSENRHTALLRLLLSWQQLPFFRMNRNTAIHTLAAMLKPAVTCTTPARGFWHSLLGQEVAGRHKTAPCKKQTLFLHPQRYPFTYRIGYMTPARTPALDSGREPTPTPRNGCFIYGSTRNRPRPTCCS